MRTNTMGFINVNIDILNQSLDWFRGDVNTYADGKGFADSIAHAIKARKAAINADLEFATKCVANGVDVESQRIKVDELTTALDELPIIQKRLNNKAKELVGYSDKLQDLVKVLVADISNKDKVAKVAETFAIKEAAAERLVASLLGCSESSARQRAGIIHKDGSDHFGGERHYIKSLSKSRITSVLLAWGTEKMIKAGKNPVFDYQGHFEMTLEELEEELNSILLDNAAENPAA